MLDPFDIVEDEKYRALIGSLVVNCAKAEHALAMFAWMLVDPADRRVGQIVLDQVTGAQIQSLVLHLLAHRTKSQTLIDKVNAVSVRLSAVRLVRNAVVHAASLVQLRKREDSDGRVLVLGTSLVRHPNRKNADYRQIPLRDEIQRAIGDATAISSEFHSFESLYFDDLVAQRIALRAQDAEESNAEPVDTSGDHGSIQSV